VGAYVQHMNGNRQRIIVLNNNEATRTHVSIENYTLAEKHSNKQSKSMDQNDPDRYGKNLSGLF